MGKLIPVSGAKMKILFAIKALENISGGAERVLANISAELTERGHEVELISFDPEATESFYPLSNKIKRHYIPIGNAQENSSLYVTLKRIKALRQLIKTSQPDIIIPFMHSMFIPMSIANIGQKTPCIASEHIVPEHYKKKPIEFLLLLFSFCLVDHVTVLSQRVKTLYPRVFHRKMTAISNPVAHHEKRSNVNGEGLAIKTILNVGRLSEQKDQATLIRAFALIHEKYPDWQVKIYGSGELQNDLSNLIKALKLEGKVMLAGTTKDISSAYEESQIFALPSKYESFGLVTAEAMSFGLPCIGFKDCPGTNEIIEHQKTGLLVDGQGRDQSFADALETLMQDTNVRAQLGNQGATASRAYSITNIADQWEKLIKDVA